MTNHLLIRSGKLEDERTKPLLEGNEKMAAGEDSKQKADEEDDFAFLGGHVEKQSEVSSQVSRSQRPAQ